jgi:hypothetical protein
VRFRSLVSTAILLAGSFLVRASGQNSRSPRNLIANDQIMSRVPAANPAPFQNHRAPLSGQPSFLLSPRGKKLAANHPNLRGWLRRMSVALPPTPARIAPSNLLRPSPEPTITMSHDDNCNQATGTQFDLQPLGGMPEIGVSLPQNETPVDFIPNGGIDGSDLVIGGANDYRGMAEPEVSNFNGNVPPHSWGFSTTGYYVHRAGNGCGASFEGGLPHVTFLPTGETLFGMGDPVYAVDSTRRLVYGADLRFGFTVSAASLFRTTVGNLNSPSVCPSGTHLTDANGNDTMSANCWPHGILVGADTNSQDFVDKPHMRADERSSGVGAGDVYLTYTLFTSSSSVIELVVCPSSFASILDCSNPEMISDPNDTSTQFSHIALRPDGVITISYASFVFNPNVNPSLSQSVDIKLVTCGPNGAPAPPACSAPSLVAHEAQPIPDLERIAQQGFRISTYPTHDNRFNPKRGEYEEFVVWTRCANPPIFPIGTGVFYHWEQCPNSDVVMSYSTGSGASMKWSQVIPVNENPNDQFFPWVRTDRDNNVVSIAYYSSENDSQGHLLQVMENDIDSDKYSAGPRKVLTKTQSNASADPILGDLNPFFGDYIGIAAKKGRVYVHFTGTNFPENFGGANVGAQKNQMTRITH